MIKILSYIAFFVATSLAAALVYFNNTYYTKSIFTQDDNDYKLAPASNGSAYMWNEKTGSVWYISSPDKPGVTSFIDKEKLRKYSVRN